MRSRLVGGAVLVLVLAGGLAAPAVGQESGGDAFGDVGEGHSFYGYIQDLAAAGLFEGTGAGCGEGDFCPERPLQRWQMAVWMVRFIDGEDPEPVAGSRFEDVDDGVWWMPFVERMADLGVTKGCGSDPPTFCPTGDVTRAQMASFLARAFELPGAPSAGFEDVDEETNVHAENISRLFAAKITLGCSTDPFRYCTGSPVKKGHMAAFIARTAAWQAEQADVNPEDLPGQPQNVAMRFVDAQYSIKKDQLLVEWQRPSSRHYDISHYLLQWRWEEASFGPSKQQRVEINNDSNDLDSSTTGFSVEVFDLNAHAVRVVAVDGDGVQSASPEALSPVSPAVFARTMKEALVDVYGDVDPWLRQTWEYIAGRDNFFSIIEKDSGRVAFVGSAYVRDDASGLSRIEVRRFHAKAYLAKTRNVGDLVSTYMHEMAHAYTLTNGLPDNPAAIAIAHLYFQHLINEHSVAPASCNSAEMLADILVGASNADIVEHYGYGTWYKYVCTGTYRPTQEAKRVVGEALSGRIPQWFYDTFQRQDGSLDLDAVWQLIGSVRERHHRTVIVYQLKDAFGGYCDVQSARSLVGGDSTGNSGNTWRDGGCRSEGS